MREGKSRSDRRGAQRWTWRLSALLYAWGAACGCADRRQAIEASDRTVVFPAARGVFQAPLDEAGTEFQGVGGGAFSFDHAHREAIPKGGPGDPPELRTGTGPAPGLVARV